MAGKEPMLTARFVACFMEIKAMPVRSGKTTLLATDQQRSVLRALDGVRAQPIAYAAYGHRSCEIGLLRLLGFNGESADLLTGRYHLGKGYRQFDTVLMRFNKPDDLSPFREGGLNAYTYCAGDPVNRVDPTGHMLKALKNIFIKPKTLKVVESIEPSPPAQPRLVDLGEGQAKWEVVKGWDDKDRLRLVTGAEERTAPASSSMLAGTPNPSSGAYVKNSVLYIPDDQIWHTFVMTSRRIKYLNKRGFNFANPPHDGPIDPRLSLADIRGKKNK